MQTMPAFVEQGDHIVVAEGGRSLLFTLAERCREIAIQVGNRGLNGGKVGAGRICHY